MSLSSLITLTEMSVMVGGRSVETRPSFGDDSRSTRMVPVGVMNEPEIHLNIKHT